MDTRQNGKNVSSFTGSLTRSSWVVSNIFQKADLTPLCQNYRGYPTGIRTITLSDEGCFDYAA